MRRGKIGAPDVQAVSFRDQSNLIREKATPPKSGRGGAVFQRTLRALRIPKNFEEEEAEEEEKEESLGTPRGGR